MKTEIKNNFLKPPRQISWPFCLLIVLIFMGLLLLDYFWFEFDRIEIGERDTWRASKISSKIFIP